MFPDNTLKKHSINSIYMLLLFYSEHYTIVPEYINVNHFFNFDFKKFSSATFLHAFSSLMQFVQTDPGIFISNKIYIL